MANSPSFSFSLFLFFSFSLFLFFSFSLFLIFSLCIFFLLFFSFFFLDAAVIMKLMKDNLILWTADYGSESEEEGEEAGGESTE